MKEPRYDQDFYIPVLNIKPYSSLMKSIYQRFSKEKRNVQKNIILYCANLIFKSKIAVSRNKNYYSKKKMFPDWHTYAYAKRAQDALEEEGYVIMDKGVDVSSATVLQTTPNFNTTFHTSRILPQFQKNPPVVDISLCPDIQIGDNLYKLPSKQFTEALLLLRSKLKSSLGSKCFTLLDFYKQSINLTKHNKQSLQYRFFINSLGKAALYMPLLNKALFSKIVLGYDDNRALDLATNVYLTRIFRKEGCGRLYQKKAKSYQNIKRKERKHLTINGKPIAELDYTSMHLYMLYSKLGKKNPYEDGYLAVIEKFAGKPDLDLRDAVKLIVIVAINSRSIHKFYPAYKKEFPGNVELLEEKGYKLTDAVHALRAVHPAIEKYLFSNSSIELMNHDSNILQNVLFQMLRKRILGLPLHDSILCQRKESKKVKEIMQREFKKYAGYDIPVKLK